MTLVVALLPTVRCRLSTRSGVSAAFGLTPATSAAVASLPKPSTSSLSFFGRRFGLRGRFVGKRAPSTTAKRYRFGLCPKGQSFARNRELLRDRHHRTRPQPLHDP